LDAAAEPRRRLRMSPPNHACGSRRRTAPAEAAAAVRAEAAAELPAEAVPNFIRVCV